MSASYEVELHTHTLASGHAFNTLDEMVATASEVGLRAIAITDHGPSMEGGSTPGLFIMGHRLESEVDGVRVLFGCESNILDDAGSLDIPDEVAGQLDVVLAGIHERTPYPPDGSRAYNTDAMVAALHNRHVDVISHPCRPAFPIDVETVGRAAADAGSALEVNLYLLARCLAERPDGTHPVVADTRRLLDVLLEAGGRFVVASDAHHRAELATLGSHAAAACRSLGVSLGDALNADLTEVMTFLEAGRGSDDG